MEKIIYLMDDPDHYVRVEMAVADEIIRFQKTGGVIGLPGTIMGARADYAPPHFEHFIMTKILGKQYGDVIRYGAVVFDPSCKNDELDKPDVCDPCWEKLTVDTDGFFDAEEINDIAQNEPPERA